MIYEHLVADVRLGAFFFAISYYEFCFLIGITNYLYSIFLIIEIVFGFVF